VETIALDNNGNKWIGTFGSGVAKFDEINWTVYNTSNSGLPDNNIKTIAVDISGNKWIGTLGGLAKFDDTNWTVYNTSNSDIPDNSVRAIVIDNSGNKWIGTFRGLAKFDNTNWVVYDTNNSGLPFNNVYTIAIDNLENKWIGTEGGLAVYREGGVVSVSEAPEEVPGNFILYQNYPNPFNPSTTIQYQLPGAGFVTLKIYDLLGREIFTLVNKEQTAGRYEVNFNASNLASGIYFYQIKSSSFVLTKKMVYLK
jgi:ligand-binding sensor domain-containing protein